MYTQHIAYHARSQPRATAIVLPGWEVSYEKFDADINRIAHRLKAILKPRGRTVVVSVAQVYLNWLVILALGRLGHVSISALERAQMPLVAPHFIVTDRSPNESTVPAITLSPAWVSEALASQLCAPPEPWPGPHESARIALSSGTTGLPKTMLFSHELVLRRIRNGPFGQSMQCHKTVLCAIGLGSFSGFGVPLRTWWFGGTVCMLQPSPEVLAAHKVTGLTVSPSQLLDLVRNLPRNFAPLPDLTITAGGSALPKQLSIQTRRRLSPRLVTVYGSNETSSIAFCPASFQDKHPNVTGIVVPGVQVEIVDEAGNLLQAGESGKVRVRSDEMIHHYLNDEATTKRAFRDGWFYPGDLGTLSKSSTLTILGRLDEVLNLGGIKISPDVIEQALADCKGVEDVGVFSMANEWGNQQPWIALVKGEGFSEEHATQVLKQKVPKTTYRVVYVPRIPRNEMGKIERRQLIEDAKKILKLNAEQARASKQSA